MAPMRLLIILLAVIPSVALPQAGMDDAAHRAHQGMQLDERGIVMNANHDILPHGCNEIGAEHVFTIHVGRKFADNVAGTTFGMSQHDVHVEPCSRVQVTLVNEDEIRHQWMVHGLPKYLYPAGMFHIEAMGGQSVSGRFIVPGEDRNYLVHCDMAQHMEKGLRGQLIVGRGSGDLWSVPGSSDAFFRSPYLPAGTPVLALILCVLAVAVTYAVLRRT